MKKIYEEVLSKIRDIHQQPDGLIPLHEPRFVGNEKKYLNDCIDSSFVSSVGKYVGEFEKMVAEYTGAKYAVATVNGTAALHIALLLSDVKPDDEVLTQALTFVATTNAVSYTGARPVFLDVDLDTMGLSPKSIKHFLDTKCEIREDSCYNKTTGRRIKACVPVHTFGHPCRIDEITEICNYYKIDVVEDAAESLGSFYKEKHTGTFGKLGTFSFNGNKIITTGGGGLIVTDDKELAKKAKHITTTAKIPHKWEFIHDMIGYNYRLTNLAAAMGCAQMENLSLFVIKKRELAKEYESFFKRLNLKFSLEPSDSKSNYWLNSLILENRKERDIFLDYVNQRGIMSRPIWQLMNQLVMYKDCQAGDLNNTLWLADRVVNIPSSVILHK